MDLVSLVGRATHARLSFMLVADEVSRVVADDAVWAELHTMTNTMHHSLFVADSLPGFLHFYRDAYVDRLRLYGAQTPLNPTKLTPLYLAPFASPAR